IVVFSMFFGVALSAMGEKGKTLVAAIDELAHVMLKITGYVMKLAPLAVLCAMAATVAVNGLEILLKFAVFMGDFYLGLFVLWALLIGAGFTVLGPRVFRLLVLIKEAFMLSFATASSEAAYPKIIDALDRFGVKRKISSFVMPMGYSFNLDGSMMYCTFATLFIAQAYGVELSLGTQLTMLLILMLTSKGMAGVPRASLVVIAATLNQFNIPEAGLLLILGVDTFLDMGRSATNAVGNSIATAVVAKWEGELLPPTEADEVERRIEAGVAVPPEAHEAVLGLAVHRGRCGGPDGRHPRRVGRHAGEGTRRRGGDARLPGVVGAVFVCLEARRADRLLDRTLQEAGGGDGRDDRARARAKVAAGDLGDAHRRDRLWQGGPRMRLHDQQPRAPEAGRLCADHLRRRHQAPGEARLADPLVPQSRGQDRGRDRGHDQRDCDARDRAALQARFPSRDRARPRRVLRRARGRQGR